MMKPLIAAMLVLSFCSAAHSQYVGAAFPASTSPEAAAEDGAVVFDGAKARPAAGLVGVGLGAAGAAQLITAGSAQSAAAAAMQSAQAARQSAALLAAQAKAARAAGQLSKACALCTQSKAAGSRAVGYDAQAAAHSDKASSAGGLGQALTAASGAIAVLDGLWDLYQGAKGEREEAGERYAIGGIKIGAGASLLISAFVLGAATGGIVAAVASAVYLGAVIYQNRHAIGNFFSSVWNWMTT